MKLKRTYSFLVGSLLIALSSSVNAEDFYELEPIRYSESEPNNVISNLEKGAIKAMVDKPTELAVIKAVLEKLNVDPATQTVVFSKSSLQKKVITPRNPRALYFSDSAYIGFVPGGDIEVIVHDPELGLVFYIAHWAGGYKGLEVVRDRACLNCHVSTRTKDVPALMIRSLSTDEDGEPDMSQASYDVTDETILAHRWGGWYVTGDWAGSTHLGNSVIDSKLSSLKDLSGVMKVEGYPAATSDIAALMVLEHQCKIHSMFVAAKFHYKRSLYMDMAINKGKDSSRLGRSSLKMAEQLSGDLVKTILFCNEAELKGDGVAGGKAFTEAFTSAATKTANGKHLRKLRLYGRLFKYRCSYMIHSKAFLALPLILQKKVLLNIHTILTADKVEKQFEHLKSREKATILEILLETTSLKEYLK